MIEQVVRQPISLPEVIALVGNWRVRKMLRLIHNDLKHDWRCETLAEEYEISVRQLHRLFSDHVGIGLPHYLNDLRVATARLLLETTTWRLHKIAEEVGFPNETTLRHAFKQKYGVLPCEYRNKMSENGARCPKLPLSLS